MLFRSGRSSTIESCFKSVAAEFDRRIRSASLTKICFTSSFCSVVSLFVLRMAHAAILLPLLALYEFLADWSSENVPENADQE